MVGGVVGDAWTRDGGSEMVVAVGAVLGLVGYGMLGWLGGAISSLQ